MVRAHHVILSAYGFWLPNDPRGSWSDFVGAWELFRFGKATTVNVRRSIAAAQHDREVRRRAKRALKHPAVQWTGVQARAIAHGFGAYAERAGLSILACAILPEHIHLVTARHRSSIEQVVRQLKGAATRHITADGLHPMATARTTHGVLPNMFSRGHWSVYLNHESEIQRACQYVNDNPIREGLQRQRWLFVRPL